MLFFGVRVLVNCPARHDNPLHDCGLARARFDETVMLNYVATPMPPMDPTVDTSNNHYWTYHDLPTLLACKRPVTASKDEDLFIAVHQVCEIAFHQMILDLDRTLDGLRQGVDVGSGRIGDLSEPAYFLKRVVQLWRTVNATMPILAGMRGFAEFRTALGPTSGFQSWQFRRIEIMSGVARHYWQGGTADASGKVHVAESEFDRHFGAEVQQWFERHRSHSLRHYAEALVAIAKTAGAPDAASWLDEHAEAGPLTRLMTGFDRAQLAFHRAHLQLAAVQLARVGVEIGTGGTSFKDYLARYEAELAPLFPMLRARPEIEEN
jgi:tryptophan 2,3-dioxygenase